MSFDISKQDEKKGPLHNYGKGNKKALAKALDKKYKESRDSMPSNEHMSKRHLYKNSKGLGN